MHCPRCHGRDIRRSLPQGIIDLLMREFHQWPFRCRSCRKRFYIFAPKQDDAEDGH
jgi:hypothetical protein